MLVSLTIRPVGKYYTVQRKIILPYCKLKCETISNQKVP